MSRITIKNIGPVTSVALELNRINVIMGPQSSGKSTIAKIVSFCQWAEKRYILDGNKFEYDFEEMFMEFHRIGDSYFSRDSAFIYESDFLKISQKGTNFKLKFESKKRNADFKKPKNIYIPAERNFVSVIPNLGKYNETNDNIMSFLYDWFDAKKNYNAVNPLPILNLGVEYAFDKEVDQLTLLKNKKILQLKDASSGLQSVTPLLMLIHYLTHGFYENSKSNSVYEREEVVKTIIDNLNTQIDGPDRDALNGFQDLNDNFVLTKENTDRLLKLVRNRGRYFFTNFIIEEPEQNLFPSTQRDLIYHLFSLILNTNRPHHLLITTHSPFVLYAINNCIMGKRISNDMPPEEYNELRSHMAWVDSHQISVWQMQAGQITSVLDERTGTVTKHYFNEIMNELLEEYYEMLNYFKDDRSTAS
ncbi:ATP-binding protein [Mucilaginibacter psychrotolerans]|uniref:ATP-binding protein n=1 Tax=Mucilaginibacter psychrotolerans TaxID=1524096 RepID=A0A4Y8SFZ4_9SPHI|nr:AAA family ATPase [Mucilaginibacter psychrotolerans]TFF37477.1 hypothetical protein E2R66_11770 [Mucilaginibacter psychrotolerans]